MTLSYIITTFNRPELLEKAVATVLRERCLDSELIIVDDNSRAPVKIPEEAVTAFLNQCRLIRNTGNVGVIGARNAGIAAAQGVYLIFLDDDDESLPNRTSDLLSVIENSDFDFVAARSYMGTNTAEKVVPTNSGFLLTLDTLLLYPPHINAIIWRKAMFAGTLGLDNRVPYLGEHISLILCLLHGGQGWLSDAIVARFTYIEAGLTQQAQQQALLKEYLTNMYQLLMEESETPTQRQLFDRILSMLRNENIRSFDDYLQRIQPIIRRFKGLV